MHEISTSSATAPMDLLTMSFSEHQLRPMIANNSYVKVPAAEQV